MTATTLGKSTRSTTTGRSAQTLELSAAASYALAKQVPDLELRGCTISTAYGDINIPPGWAAMRLALILRHEIRRGGL